MKTRVVSIFVLISLLFTLVACSSNENEDTVKAYLEMAESLVKTGDYDSAISILETGIMISDSTELKDYLETVKKMKESGAVPDTTAVTEETVTEAPEEPEKLDISEFIGYWEGEDTELIIEEYDGGIWVSLVWANSLSNVAYCEGAFDEKNCNGNEYTASFDDDGFGNNGQMVLTFGDEIAVDVENTVTADGQYGIINADGVKLVKSETPKNYLDLSEKEDRYIINNFIDSLHWSIKDGFLRDDCDDMAELVYHSIRQMLSSQYDSVRSAISYSYEEFKVLFRCDIVDTFVYDIFGIEINSMQSPVLSTGTYDFKDGYYKIDMGFGGSYKPFVHASNMVYDSTGYFSVDFEVFDADYTFDYDMGKYMTNAEIGVMSALTKIGSGNLVAKRVTYSTGEESYCLSRYNVTEEESY